MSDAANQDREQASRAVLEKEFYRLGWLGAAALAGAGALLGLAWHWRGAWQWLLQAGLLWLFICYQSHRRLNQNRPDPAAPLYDDLGWGNRLTLLRAWMIAVVGGFLLQPWPEGAILSWLPGMVYFGAAVLDRVDGFVARRSGHPSLLGNDLDMISDALGLAVASLLAYGYGQVHFSYLLVGVAYYLFHGGLMWRRARGLPVYPLPPAMHRRAWAGFQMGFLVAVLWPLFYPPVTALAGFAFMLPALVGFVTDWLIVSGRINRQAQAVDRFFRRLTYLSQTLLQPALRLAIVVMLLVSVGGSGFVALAGSLTWPESVIGGGFVLTATLILLGIAGRAVSLALVGLLGWYYIEIPLAAVDYVLFCCVVWLMLLGTGRFSLWLADDRWVNRYDGA